MSGGRTAAILVLLGGLAFATNPDEASFQKHVEQLLKKGGSHWLESKVVSHVSALVYERKDFKIFSYVQVPDSDVGYLGCFGLWFAIPTLATLRTRIRQISD